jgi:hypothetical protein
MESHQKSAVSPLARQQSSTEWLTEEQKERLRQSTKDFQAYVRNTPQFQRWLKKFQEMKRGNKCVWFLLQTTALF